MKKLDIKTILRDPRQRRELMVNTIIATQAREGIDTTREQAEAAYDAIARGRTRCERERGARALGRVWADTAIAEMTHAIKKRRP